MQHPIALVATHKHKNCCSSEQNALRGDATEINVLPENERISDVAQWLALVA